jgi:hypothetical protein
MSPEAHLWLSPAAGFLREGARDRTLRVPFCAPKWSISRKNARRHDSACRVGTKIGSSASRATSTVTQGHRLSLSVRRPRAPRQVMMAPFAVFEKAPLQEKRLRGKGSALLWGQRWARLVLGSRRAQVMPQRGWPAPTITASASQGPRSDDGPFRRSLEPAGLQGKCRRVRGVRALWGQRWTRVLFLTRRRSTATTAACPSLRLCPRRSRPRPSCQGP